MAKRFLTHVNLKGNQILEASLEQLASDPTPFEGRMYYNTTDNAVKYYDGSAWITLGEGGVTSLLGTPNEVEVTGGSVGALTVGLPSSITVDVVGNLTGTAASATYAVNSASANYAINSGSASYATTAGVANTVTPGSVTLGTSTSGNYVETIIAGNGIGVSGTGSESASVTISNTGVLSLTGTANEVDVSGSTGAVTIGLPADVVIANSLLVQGALTVSGSATYVNTEIVTVDDNIVLLNSNASGAPTQNGGIEVERGDQPNVQLIWNETTDQWEATSSNGSTYYAVLLSGDTTASDISDFNEAAQDAVGNILVDGTTVNLTYTDGTPSITAEVTLAGTSYLSTTGGLAVDKNALETALTADGYTKKFSQTIGDNSATSFNIDHNFATRDVIVNVYDMATYDTVEVDIVRATTNRVTVSFTVAPATNAYRVVVIG